MLPVSQRSFSSIQFIPISVMWHIFLLYHIRLLILPSLKHMIALKFVIKTFQHFVCSVCITCMEHALEFWWYASCRFLDLQWKTGKIFHSINREDIMVTNVNANIQVEMVRFSKCTPSSVPQNKECKWNRVCLNVLYAKIWLTEGKTEIHQCQMYITNWHRRMGQSISHCMWLRRHARFVWTRTQMIVLCSPQPAALSAASDSAPYCFNWASKPGNDMSLQPALVSYILCLPTKPFPLSALLVLETRFTGRLV